MKFPHGNALFKAYCWLAMAGVSACSHVTHDHVRLKAHDLMYSCGDCHVYRVDSCLAGCSRGSPNLEGKEFALAFEEADEEARFDICNAVNSCTICLGYQFEGWMAAKGEALTLHVSSFSMEVDSLCCDLGVESPVNE